MTEITTKLESIDWAKIHIEMDKNGYAVIKSLLTDEQSEEIKSNYENPIGYRKTVVMERYRFGLGEYKYFKYPLPNLIQLIRESIYPKLAPIANVWMQSVKIDKIFPENLMEFSLICKENNQTKPTPLILKYGKGGFNTLHQDLYGEIYFPIQTAVFLSEPEVDFTGGEFVLTEQIPRAQSKAIVLKPKKGDMIIFATNFRPKKGIKGYYRINMKHGVSEVLDGERYTLGVIFHDALS